MANLFTPDPKGALGPEDYNYFLARRRQVNDTYSLGDSQNRYQRQIADLGYNQQRQGLVQRFAQQRRALPGGYARRGMLNSGIYQRGRSDFMQNRDTQLGNLDQQYGLGQFGFDMAGTQLEQTRRSALDDLESQEVARRAALAAALRAVQ